MSIPLTPAVSQPARNKVHRQSPSSYRRLRNREPPPMPHRPARKLLTVATVVIGLGAVAFAQFRGRRMPVYGDGPIVGPVDRGNVPIWPIDKHFAKDVWTVAR